MAPHIGGVLHQSRDDDSDSIYNHPAIMFFGLLLLCFCIMAPMFWMLWMMRNDNRTDVVTEERLHRIRNWRRIKFPEQQQQQQANQQPIAEDGGEAVVVDSGRFGLSNVNPTLLRVINSTQQVVTLRSQQLWKKVSQPFINLTRRPTSRRSRSHSRAGRSIDLPIMRQPAWQKLASGSIALTPSTTLTHVSEPTSKAIDTTEVYGLSGHRQIGSSACQMEQGQLGQHAVVAGVTVDELRKPQNSSTVGLAIG